MLWSVCGLCRTVVTRVVMLQRVDCRQMPRVLLASAVITLPVRYDITNSDTYTAQLSLSPAPTHWWHQLWHPATTALVDW